VTRPRVASPLEAQGKYSLSCHLCVEWTEGLTGHTAQCYSVPYRQVFHCPEHLAKLSASQLSCSLRDGIGHL
jgi:hypothetical protein